eukprot:2463657-Amphidinium_carterae.1
MEMEGQKIMAIRSSQEEVVERMEGLHPVREAEVDRMVMIPPLAASDQMAKMHSNNDWEKLVPSSHNLGHVLGRSLGHEFESYFGS